MVYILSICVVKHWGPYSPEALMSKNTEQMFKKYKLTKKLSKDISAFETLSPLQNLKRHAAELAKISQSLQTMQMSYVQMQHF